MSLNPFGVAAVGASALILLFSAETRAEDWERKTFDIVGGGELTIEYPQAWAKRPKVETFDNVLDLQFGPYGPKAKPVFFVHIQSAPTVDPVTADNLMEITKAEIARFANVAFETDIPINDLQGPHSVAHYFSITDRESRWGEFDYATVAIISSGNLLTKCYFLSSDGAPDFGADAIRMMESIHYIAPEIEDEEK